MSTNLISLRMMESAVANTLCVDCAYTQIDNRHLYHGSLNWPPYDPLRSNMVRTSSYHDIEPFFSVG